MAGLDLDLHIIILVYYSKVYTIPGINYVIQQRAHISRLN